MNIKTHSINEGGPVPIVEELPCNCGGANESRFHTIHKGNPTGHAVGCPVYLRWQCMEATGLISQKGSKFNMMLQRAVSALARGDQGRNVALLHICDALDFGGQDLRNRLARMEAKLDLLLS